MRIRIGDSFIRYGEKLKVIGIKYSEYYGRECLVMNIKVGSNVFIPIDSILYNEFLEVKKNFYNKTTELNKEIEYIQSVEEKIKKLLKIK